MRCSAWLSSTVVTIFSAKGTPRIVSIARADKQGLQFSTVYSVTGYLDVTCRNSKGRVLDVLPLEPTAPDIVFALLAAGDDLSEKVTLPSGPTMR